jgi:hypothetical protein
MWRVVISSKVPMAVRVRERVAAVPDSFRLTVRETLRRTSEGSSGELPVPEPLAVSRVPVLAGPEPLSAEFCGLPQPASSRTAESTSRNSLRVLMSGPLDEASQDLSGVYSLSLCWSSLVFPSVTKAANS